MRIEYDKLTGEKLHTIMGNSPAYIKLVNDTEGCASNGVYSLHMLNEPLSTDIHVESADFKFLVDKQEQILFDDVMRLRADEHYPSYRLSSNSMLYSTHVILKDKRA